MVLSIATAATLVVALALVVYRATLERRRQTRLEMAFERAKAGRQFGAWPQRDRGALIDGAD